MRPALLQPCLPIIPSHPSSGGNRGGNSCTAVRPTIQRQEEENPMSLHSHHLSVLISERLARIMEYSFSRHAIHELIEQRFSGDFKNLNITLFEESERKATAACVEFAGFLRLLDDQCGLSEYLRARGLVAGRVKPKGQTLQENEP
jgi:hypothetical protein